MLVVIVRVQRKMNRVIMFMMMMMMIHRHSTCASVSILLLAFTTWRRTTTWLWHGCRSVLIDAVHLHVQRRDGSFSPPNALTLYIKFVRQIRQSASQTANNVPQQFTGPLVGIFRHSCCG